MITIKELNEAVKLCEEDLRKFGIPVPTVTYEISKRMTRSLGICYFEYKKVTIRISHLLEEKSLLRNTVMHEMLHAVVGPHVGHGGKWLELANKITNAMPEVYIIQQYTNSEQHQQLQTALEGKIKKDGGGIITCERCGSKEVVSKRRGVYKNPEHYKCKCGGKLILEKF